MPDLTNESLRLIGGINELNFDQCVAEFSSCLAEISKRISADAFRDISVPFIRATLLAYRLGERNPVGIEWRKLKPVDASGEGLLLHFFSPATGPNFIIGPWIVTGDGKHAKRVSIPDDIKSEVVLRLGLWTRETFRPEDFKLIPEPKFQNHVELLLSQDARLSLADEVKPVAASQPNTASNATVAAKGKRIARTGKPPLSTKERRHRQSILRKYETRPGGQAKKTFCAAQGISLDALNRCLAWHRISENRQREQTPVKRV